jgi:hypothetical protein
MGKLKVAGGVAAFAGAAIAALATGTAHAATTTQVAAKPTTHCVVVLDKLKPGQKVSHVVSRTCGTAAQTKAPKAMTLLIQTYYDINYGGDSTQFFGRSGGCDGDGYGIPTMGPIDQINISSFKTFNNCNYTNLWGEAWYLGHGRMYPNTYQQWYIGDDMNDDVGSIRVWHV